MKMMKFSWNRHVGTKDARDCESGIDERHWKKWLLQYRIFKITILDQSEDALIYNEVYHQLKSVAYNEPKYK